MFENYAPGDPRSPIPDLAEVDIDSLPRTPRDLLQPYYRPLRSGAWMLNVLPLAVCDGYWTGRQLVEGLVVLSRHRSTWMSITPMEIESQRIGIDLARGHVAVFGLGMGWAAAMCALKDEVERVTVVEMDDEVLAMHAQLDLFGQLPGGVGGKVQVVEADALEWQPDTRVDLLMPDIWLDMVSWDRPGEVHDMQDNVQADMVYFWGQELELARHAVKAGRALDDAGLAATAMEFDLPLVGLDTPDYAARTKRAAQQWMKGRWLDGTQVPPDLRSAADDMQDG